MSQTSPPPAPTIPPPPAGAAAERTPADQLARALTLARRGLAHWKVSLAILVVVQAIAVGFAAKIPHTYEAEASLSVKPKLRTDNQQDGEGGPTALAARLRDIVMTRSCLDPILRRFHLFPKVVEAKGEEEAVNEMKRHVQFSVQQTTRYILGYEGETKEQARDVAEALAAMLIDEYTNGSVSEARRTADFMKQQAGNAEAELERATLELARFVSDHTEFAILRQSLATGGSLGAMRVTPAAPKPIEGQSADPQLAAMYRERARLTAAAHPPSPGTPAAPQAGGPSSADEALLQAKAEVDSAAKDFARAQADVDAKSNLTDDHPDMKAAKSAAAAAGRRLQQAKSALTALVGAQATAPVATAAPGDPALEEKLRSIDTQIVRRQAQLRAASHSTASAAPESDAGAEGDSSAKLEAEWEHLVGAVGAARAHNDDMRHRAEGADLSLLAAEAAAKDLVTIVEPPTLPIHPAKGNRAKAALIGSAVALLLAIVYAAARVFLNDTVIDSGDIEALGLLEVLGTLPKIDEPEPFETGTLAHRAEEGPPRGV